MEPTLKSCCGQQYEILLQFFGKIKFKINKNKIKSTELSTSDLYENSWNLFKIYAETKLLET